MPKVTSKPAGKQAIKAGPSGKMQKFKAAGPQKADRTSVEMSGGGGNYAKGGPSGKMQKFSPVGAQKPGITSVK